jgi:hypothetical protein
MRWGYGGRRRSCDDEEGGEGELDAPRTKNGERRARAMLTVNEARDGVGRTHNGGIQTRWRRGFGQRRRRGRDGARRGDVGDFGQPVGTAGRNGAVRTPTRGPKSAFNALERRGAWQPRGNGARRLTGGTHSSVYPG